MIAPVASYCISLLLVAIMLRFKRVLPQDHPNHRSLHETPIPRSGGVGILLGVAFGWVMDWPSPLLPMLGLALTLGALSLLDDFRGLSVALRFGTQVAVAALLIGSWPAMPGDWIGSALAVLTLVWMSNLYNFMDGSDGLAGGMALFGFGFYALAAWESGASSLAVAAASVSAASAGFLMFNFHPARIFMGDAGSIPLGFLAAALGMMGWQDGLWPLAFPLLVFSPFIVDASVTLAKRLLRGEKFWQAHRGHYYQRLIRLGLGHRNTALVEYALMLACGGSALCLLGASAGAQITVVLAWAVVYGFILSCVDKAWARQASENRP